MKDQREEPGKSNCAIELVAAWFVVQFELTTSLLVTFSQLQSSVGKDIAVKGLTRKADVLYAGELTVGGGER